MYQTKQLFPLAKLRLNSILNESNFKLTNERSTLRIDQGRRMPRLVHEHVRYYFTILLKIF